MSDERTRPDRAEAAPPHPGVAVVTGAGRQRGIGCAVAMRLAQDGFAVVVHERSDAARTDLEHEVESGWRGAQSVVAEIEQRGGRGLAVTGDLVAAETRERLFHAARSLGPMAALVNNAGTAGEANSYRAHETPDDVWEQTVRINLTAVHEVTRNAVALLSESRAPNRSIVNVSSTAAQRVLPWYGAYCATKAAVERLSQQQAVELAPLGIRVNVVSPGSTSTDMIAATLARVTDRTGMEPQLLERAVIKMIPMRRFADASEIAAAISFMVGPDASFVTGQILTVDGGMTLV